MWALPRRSSRPHRLCPRRLRALSGHCLLGWHSAHPRTADHRMPDPAGNRGGGILPPQEAPAEARRPLLKPAPIPDGHFDAPVVALVPTCCSSARGPPCEAHAERRGHFFILRDGGHDAQWRVSTSSLLARDRTSAGAAQRQNCRADLAIAYGVLAAGVAQAAFKLPHALARWFSLSMGFAVAR